jgi:hypothetical protein
MHCPFSLIFALKLTIQLEVIAHYRRKYGIDNAYNCKRCTSERTVIIMSIEDNVSPMWDDDITVGLSHLLTSLYITTHHIVRQDSCHTICFVIRRLTLALTPSLSAPHVLSLVTHRPESAIWRATRRLYCSSWRTLWGMLYYHPCSAPHTHTHPPLCYRTMLN